MKKFMFAAMAALAITSCSQNEEIEAPSQKAEIGFNTIVSKTTRAGITDEAALQGSGFTVYAYTSAEKIASGFPAASEVLMNGVVATYNSGWVLDGGPYYWPTTGNVHFYAYATDGKAICTAATASTYPTLNYTIEDVAGDQKDFVVAKSENLTISANEISLSFGHALTQVNFSAKGAEEGFTYTVTGITISGVAKTGTYNFGTGEWTAGTELMASYNYPIKGGTIGGKTETALDTTTPINTLMLMPQKMPAAAKILVSYSVTKTGELKPLYTATDTEISLDGKIAWEAGKKVRYTLELAVGQVSMSFTPSVGDWAEPEGNSPNK